MNELNELFYYLKPTQEELKETLYHMLAARGYTPENHDGYLYAKGDIPLLLVAHLDTVCPEPPKHIEYSPDLDLIYNPYGILGGDDRCGVYAIMQLLRKYKPYVLFAEDEEIGCKGAYKAAKTLKAPDVKYIIEFDRRGKDDCVFYSGKNDEFIKYIEGFGFQEEMGSFSDIAVLGSAWDIGAVNLSSGYFNEHTYDEYIIFSYLKKTIERVEKMIKVLDKAPYFDYKEIKYERVYYGGNNYFGNSNYGFSYSSSLSSSNERYWGEDDLEETIGSDYMEILRQFMGGFSKRSESKKKEEEKKQGKSAKIIRLRRGGK